MFRSMLTRNAVLRIPTRIPGFSTASLSRAVCTTTRSNLALKQVLTRSPAVTKSSRGVVLPASVRFYSTPIGKIDKPTYQLTFTCKVCDNRSSHLVSKQAYHEGTVLIQCPSCKNRHLIADHLNVFGQGKKTLEEILAEKGDGEVVQTKIIDLNQIGDIEWEGPNQAPEQVKIPE